MITNLKFALQLFRVSLLNGSKMLQKIPNMTNHVIIPMFFIKIENLLACFFELTISAFHKECY